MSRAKYVVFEGTEGCGKSTQAQKLVDHLRGMGLKVLHTREPGTVHSPLTMELRGIMLDAKYDAQHTFTSRELISQAIRSIHLERVVLPALSEFDYVVQDRGLLSGLAYGRACGNSLVFLRNMMQQVVAPAKVDPYDLYDLVVYLKSDAERGLARAQGAKQEFAAGDAIEAKGTTFLAEVAQNMDEMVQLFQHCTVKIEGKGIEEVFREVRLQLGV